ncbi:teneurin-3-like [Tropilaelaps mercedesae]|uniref:Teneurin-3-like n=1 Tax=Tropilaelaps mercedesae TaxID=418985 RepID=A0A1V9Y1S4_9ACAR|nr:teneurin-3-like [Tropilaelaps mercedesae]
MLMKAVGGDDNESDGQWDDADLLQLPTRIRVQFEDAKQTSFHKLNFQSSGPSSTNWDYALSYWSSSHLVPTHTRYDFSEILNARSSGIRTRKAATTQEMVSIEFIHFLDRGRWYLSIYNDGDQQEEISPRFHVLMSVMVTERATWANAIAIHSTQENRAPTNYVPYCVMAAARTLEVDASVNLAGKVSSVN